MANQVKAYLPIIQKTTLRGIDLEEDSIAPAYEGRSILNLPGSICQGFGIPEIGWGGLHPDMQSVCGSGIQRVVLVLVDALGLNGFTQWLECQHSPLWNSLIADGLLAPLTSVVPSTTVSALTSIWTGKSPAEHGVVGYEMWLKEFGIVANMVTHTPIAFSGMNGSLKYAGFDPLVFLNQRTLGSHLRESAGIRSYAFQNYSIAQSGLSTMLFQDVDVHAFNTPTDVWISVRQLVESRPEERSFIWVYWGAVDGYSHRFGPDNERTIEEFTSFMTALERSFLQKLPEKERRHTLFLLVADHGQITTLKNPIYDLKNHPEFLSMLTIYPTGENRLIYLYPAAGKKQVIIEYMQTQWPGEFTIVDSEVAIREGMFGPGKIHPKLKDRLGELIVIPRGNSYLWWANKENPLTGRHGGLSADEMLVPFLAVRL